MTLNGTSAQTVSGTSYPFNNLTLSGTASATAGSDLTFNGNLSIGDGTTFATASTHILSVAGTTTVGGGTSGTFTLAGTASTPFTGDVTINTGGAWNNSGNAAVSMSGNLTNSGTFTAGSGTYTLSGSSKTIAGTISIPSLTMSGTYTNNGTLTVGTALSGTGGLKQGTGATLNLGGTSGITTLTATASGNTVNYSGAAQTVHANAYYHLTLSGSGTVTMPTSATAVGGNFTMSGTASATAGAAINTTGNVTLGSGTTFNAGSFTHDVGGNWTNNGATFTASTSAIKLNGASTQTLTGATTFNNLTNDNSSGITLASDEMVSGTLALGANMITTSANSLIIGAAGTVTRSTGYIIGNEQKAFGSTGSGQSFTFNIGDSTDYEPLAVSSLNVTAVGNLKASTTGGKHPQLGTAGINSSGCVAQYWTLSAPSGTYGTYTAQFTYPSGHSTGTASGYLVKLWNGSSWASAGSVSGTPTTTTTTITGISSFGDFAIGDTGPVANPDSFSRDQNVSLKILQSDLLANDTGTSISFTSVNSPSAQGATLTASGSYVFYTPVNNNNDSFTYNITDGNGATATGTVTVNVNATGTPGGASGSISVSGGVATVKMYGIPGVQYDVQRATVGASGPWTTLSAAPPLNTTPPFTASTSDGSVSFTDNFSDLGSPPASAYYRIMAH